MAGNDFHGRISLVWRKRNAFATIQVDFYNFMSIKVQNFSSKIRKMTPRENENGIFNFNTLLHMAGNDLHWHISLVWWKRNGFATIQVNFYNFMSIKVQNFSIKIRKMTPRENENSIFNFSTLLHMAGNDLHGRISLVWRKRNGFATIQVHFYNFMSIKVQNFSSKIRKMTPRENENSIFTSIQSSNIISNTNNNENG